MLNEQSIIKDNVKNFRLITEWVGRNDVIDAVNNSDIAYIYYAGDKTVNRGFRTIEPYLLGVHATTGNLVLRAWQQAGASDTRKDANREADQIPGWRLFRLDGITSFMKTFKKFDPSNPRPKFNPADKDMVNIIAVANSTPRQDTEVKGTDSIVQPDTSQTKKSFFDKQTSGFKDFATPNTETKQKKDVADLYGVIKFHHKKDPLKYIVVKKDNKLWYDKVENEGKYSPEELVGNLNTLYRENSGAAGTTKQTNRSFLQKQYDEFEKSLQD